MSGLLKRAVKFGLTGLVTTAVAYAAFIPLLQYMGYVPAASISWVCSVGCGFLLNRRFTFGISGPEHRRRDLAAFLLGAAIQYALAIAGYTVLLGWWGLDPSLAFLVNLVLTTSFSFAFLNLVAFARAARG